MKIAVAKAGESISIELEEDVDIRRGKYDCLTLGEVLVLFSTSITRLSS
jgi:sulfate adenylyltransferase subunit 1 (EFTu-like GTPase family)